MNLQVGQEVKISTAKGNLLDGYRVTKISPAGYITVERGNLSHRFNKDGVELSTVKRSQMCNILVVGR